MQPPPPDRRRIVPLAIALIAVAAVVGAIVASSGGGDGSSAVSGGGSPTAGGGGTQGTTKAAPGDPSPVYEAAAGRALRSVVQIASAHGLGSGVVFDKAGNIVTNAHVVEGADHFTVVGPDGKEHPAVLRGSFPQNDLAVVRLTDHASLEPARFADSSKVKVGEAVLALGSPLGLRSSVTDGIVSAVSRTVSEGDGVALPSVIQTSAPINHGNSGGALVDLGASVVGVPTLAAIDPELGSAAPGVGFAISSNAVKHIATQLVEKGKVVSTGRAWLGVELVSVPSGGVLIAKVTRGGPADKAGLKPGDLIVSIDGQPIESVDDVAVAIAAHKPGDHAKIKVEHQSGGSDTVDVTLGELPAGG